MASGKSQSELVDALQASLDRIYSLDPRWKERGEWPDDVDGAILHPPAPQKAIDEFEKRIGRAFPPSYRQFLRTHNGWEHFWGDVTLTGVSGAHTARFLKKVKEYEQYQRDEQLAGVLSKFSTSEIAAWEAEDPRHLYLPNHLAFGTDFAGGLWLFDTRTSRRDGEMSAVFWTLGYGVRDSTRAETFGHFLEAALSAARLSLKDLLDDEKSGAERKRRKSVNGRGSAPTTSKTAKSAKKRRA